MYSYVRRSRGQGASGTWPRTFAWRISTLSTRPPGFRKLRNARLTERLDSQTGTTVRADAKYFPQSPQPHPASAVPIDRAAAPQSGRSSGAHPADNPGPPRRGAIVRVVAGAKSGMVPTATRARECWIAAGQPPVPGRCGLLNGLPPWGRKSARIGDPLKQKRKQPGAKKIAATPGPSLSVRPSLSRNASTRTASSSTP